MPPSRFARDRYFAIIGLARKKRERARNRRVSVPLPAAAAHAPIGYMHNAVFHYQAAMIGKHFRVERNSYFAVFESRLIAWHILPVPFVREHHLANTRAVTLHRSLRQILAITARVEGARDHAREAISNIKENLFLLLKWDIAQLNYKRRMAHQAGLNCNGQITLKSPERPKSSPNTETAFALSPAMSGAMRSSQKSFAASILWRSG